MRPRVWLGVANSDTGCLLSPGVVKVRVGILVDPDEGPGCVDVGIRSGLLEALGDGTDGAPARTQSIKIAWWEKGLYSLHFNSFNLNKMG